MNSPVVLVGLGEMGGVFARGLLRSGIPVFPVVRGQTMQDAAKSLPDPQMVLIAVGENDIANVLADIPETWKSRIALLQNELLPRDWQSHGIKNPTVISVWFEKKKGQDVKVLIPSPVFGPSAQLLTDALASIQIPARLLRSAEELEFELVVKNIYILTTNIAGLAVGGNVHELWNNHRELASEMVNEVIDIQEWMTGNSYNRNQLLQGFLQGVAGDPEHKCMGRSAPARLARALTYADKAKLDVPLMRKIQRENVE